MFRKLRYKGMLFMMLAKFRKGDYFSAYEQADYIVRKLSKQNIRIILFKAYLMVLLKDEEIAKNSLQEFYNLIMLDGNAFKESTINNEERKWLLTFAEYLLVVLTGEGSEQFGRGSVLPVASRESIDFSKVRGLMKRMFPPQHLGDIEKVLK